MNDTNRLQYLRYALYVFGAVFVVGIYPLTIVWSSGWNWGQPESLMMILGLYATLGVFLVLAARDPLRHLSLIWFTVWSSVVHAGIMGVEALMNPTMHGGHLFGDVPVLLLVAIVLAYLTPRGKQTVTA